MEGFFEMKLSKMVPIRYFSFMNEWLDFVVFVPVHLVETAKKNIRDGLDMFWDDEYETFGDAVTAELEAADVPYLLVYMPWDYKNDCADSSTLDWEPWLDSINKQYPIVTMN